MIVMTKKNMDCGGLKRHMAVGKAYRVSNQWKQHNKDSQLAGCTD